MKCSHCGEREGVVSLTQIIEDDVRTVSLCAKCAAEKGIATGVGIADTPLGGFLAALGEGADPDAPLSAALESRCSGGGASPSSAAVPDPTTLELREQLRRAIASEQFELAAQLRDRLRDRE